MLRTRIATVLAVLLFAAVAAPAAPGSEGISAARALGGGTKTTSATSSASARTGGGGNKEALAIVTTSPAEGATLSGAVVWEIGVTAGSPSRVEFAIDGSAKWTDSSSPFTYGADAGTLDTTKLSNGSHTLSATAVGARGVKATTKVTVTVQNAAPVPAPEPTPEEGGGGSIYWGATIGSQLTGSQAPWDMSAVTSFEENLHKQVSTIQFFQPFAQCNPSCSFYPFPTTPLENIRRHGAIPVLSWSSQSIPSTLNEPDFQLSDVISGRYDAYIREFATKAKAWGHPFFLRFNWEMNGDWFPWAEGVNGNGAGQYVAAWRHVHDIFSAVGASNVTWVWCPNVEFSGSTPLSSLYPGDAYVDWTGLDGYNWGTNPNKPDKWKTFTQVYRATYRNIVETLAPSKPMMIGEVASSEYGGSKATWIKEMLTAVPAEYPKIRALLWFDKYDSNMDWPIETSSSAITAFAEGLQNPAYTANTFSSLGATTILPLG